ncbi:MAG: hypothetical protein HRT44_07900, partial [Bdellovibrionales bacterium]|nr:hypothetical protein [Bdellovibrionales bacterium]NQZ19162.1 hypothetical protein [Bdellovibrionales bacterium]
MNSIFTFIMLSFLSMPVWAGYNGSVSFSQNEISNHRAQIKDFVAVAAQCLESYQEEHLDFYENNCRQIGGREVCLSKFYGDRRYSKFKDDYRPDGKALEYLPQALKNIGFPTSYVNKTESTSCVGMALDCLKQGFLSTGQKQQWNKVLKFTKDNGAGGTALQHALSLLGWKTYYWNPSLPENIVENMKKWDIEELNWESKGHHEYRYNRVMNKNRYWFNRVDNKTDLVGFGSGEPEVLQDVAFWVGTAHTGYHVFPGTFGDVVEAHSTRHITSVDNLEFSRFSPFAVGGGPRWTKT